MVVAPKLVWSRMSSQGQQQTAKLMFVVGEQGRVYEANKDGLTRPSKEGLFLGNNALDPVHKSNYVFYWKANTTKSGFTRIQVRNRVHGDTLNVGRYGFVDPNDGKKGSEDDVFACPTAASSRSKKGFSYAYTPVNNAEFGLFAPIANGSAFRVNFEIISIPGLRDNDFEGNPDPGKRLRLQREKIAGFVGELSKDKKGNPVSMMRGAGRNYSRRMGVLAYKGVGQNSFQTTTNFVDRISNVRVGDLIKFKISADQIPGDTYTGSKGAVVTVNDINQEIRSQQVAADDAMQVGETFAIGSTVWQVIERGMNIFPGDEDPDTQDIKLECIETEFSVHKTIGIVGKDKQFSPEGGFLT